MKNKIYYYLVMVSAILLLGSCVSKQKMVYFQDVDGIEMLDVINKNEPKIQVGDILSIQVSAIDMEAALPFNLYENTGNGTPNLINHLVNSDGEINFPVLGTLKVIGFSTKTITNHLTNLLNDYIKKPIVNVRLVNFKVTVLGEVKSPGTYTIPNERLSIIEAIGMAGDLTIQGKRTQVTLIREQNGKRISVQLDLTTKKIFDSPYFFLAQNDIIYIEPNKTKINSSAVGANTSILISSLSALISLIAILTR